LALDEQAASYLVTLKNHPRPVECEKIRAWIAADPRHAVAFARAEAAWDLVERLKMPPAAIGE
jgi:transmembrane sensor